MLKFYTITKYVSINNRKEHYVNSTKYLFDDTADNHYFQTETIKSLPAWIEYYEKTPFVGVSCVYTFNKQKLKFYSGDTLIEIVSAYKDLTVTFTYKFEETNWYLDDLKRFNGEKVIKFLKQEWERL